MADYYKTLGVSKTASKEEIKRAYKKLAKQYHPDLNQEEGAAEKFKEINEAAAVLGDDKKRQQYDNMGHSAYQQAGRGGGFNTEGFDFSNFNFDDIFDMFTGGFSQRKRTMRGDDLRYDLTLTLEEAAEGLKKNISLRKHVACTECNGKGGKNVSTCSTCSGHGVVRQMKRTPFGMFQTTATCRACEGTGEEFAEECAVCDGHGIVTEMKTLEVSIPAGVDNGTRVRISGEGDAGPRGSHAGDLYIFIAVKEHPVFKREGDDIHVDAPVAYATMVFGGEIIVPTLDGEAKIKIPRGTQTHTVFRLKNKGIKHVNHFGSGDQYVRAVVETPEKLTKKQEQALKEFAKLTDDKPYMNLFKLIKEKLT